MRKLAATLAIAAGTFVLVNPSPAQALPSGCVKGIGYASTTGHATDYGYARCEKGTGHVRVMVYCTNNPASGGAANYYGPWVGVPYTSTKFCPSTRPYAISTLIVKGN
ncbi:hypothetical protein HNP84_000094 [Thermocatellispora tengchongensis]|uniref:Secreted protein n=1 Tax=Thermocatellispora tengchongensis TaxID=1073253 RepID=A0A840NW55_9ACTN|nr:hypothetical protein [Thermocatellispora tengchongensis]MBB5130406.1 hypothetical protein [Thermocatellispora tengchongensis]